MQMFVEPLLSKEEGDRIWKDIYVQAEALGLMKASRLSNIVRLSLLSGLFLFSLGLAWFLDSTVLRCAAYLGLSLVLAQFAFLAHDAGHGSLSPRKRTNDFYGQLAMTLVAGMPFGVWFSVHREHHRYCQTEGRDPDMDVDLFVSLTEKSLREKGPIGRFLTRRQGITLWILSLLFAFSQRHQYQLWVLKDLRRFRWDAIVLILHFGLWFVLPIFLFKVPPALCLAAYVFPLLVLGPHLAAIFWINHIGMPLVQDPARFSFLEHQVRTSRTILNRWKVDWLFGGLNYQIEHHLLPQIPSRRLPQLQRIVSDRLNASRLPYRTLSWTNAVKEVGRHINRIARLSA